MPAHGVMFHHSLCYPPGGAGSISGDELTRWLNRSARSASFKRDFLWRTQHDQLNPSDLCLTFDDNLLYQYATSPCPCSNNLA